MSPKSHVVTSLWFYWTDTTSNADELSPNAIQTFTEWMGASRGWTSEPILTEGTMQSSPCWLVLCAVASRLLCISSALFRWRNNASSGAGANQSAAFWRWGRVLKHKHSSWPTDRPVRSVWEHNTCTLVSTHGSFNWFPSFYSSFICFSQNSFVL